jgi:hypothetical protein
VDRNAFSGVPIRPTLPTKKCCYWWINSSITNFPLFLSQSQSSRGQTISQPEQERRGRIFYC